MKTEQQISKELNNNTLTQGINVAEYNNIISFYEKYPRYEKLDAAAVAIILRLIAKGRKVTVRKFENDSLWFVGPFGDDPDVPLASIGDWTCKKSWKEDLKNCSTFVQEIIWNF